MKFNKTKIVTPLAALALILSAGGGMVAEAHAATTTTTPAQTQQDAGTHVKPAAMGTVTAVSGDTITLTDSQSNTTYSVDATTATIMKELNSSSTDTTGTRQAPTAVTVSDIAVGDHLMVEGTVSGTNITATRINDGEFHGGMGGDRGGQGVVGTVTAVNGSTLTVTGKNGTTYTVDASAATASKIQTITVSDVAVGDTIGIQGATSGTSITAKHIMDGVMTPPADAAAPSTSTAS